MKITFLGAAGEVTGSQHLLETDRLRILLDCGLFQGPRRKSRSKNEQFHCEPKRLDAVILSHAHIDHCGNLPRLYRQGFRGPVFCTSASADVASIMLRDSAKIQQEDVKYLQRHLKPGHPPVEPLYNEDDVRGLEKLFETLDYDDWHDLAPDFQLRFSDAGHILGSAICEMQLKDQGENRRVVFTGDLGRRDLPLLRDPALIDGCDVLISESTYGNRVHLSTGQMRDNLLRIFRRAVQQQGKVIIPAFSLGRTQRVVYYLNELTNSGELPQIPVYVDSPLSSRLTPVYVRHQNILDEVSQSHLQVDDNLFDFPGLTYTASRQESIALNRQPGPFVVISASGMCENGRVVHHLKNALTSPANTIMIIGYQAEHTLGRRLVERQPKVRIFDREYELKAKVEVVNGLSSHADAEDFKWWYSHLAKTGGIGQCFLVHGEPESARALAALVRDYCDEEPIIPQLYESFEV